MTAIQKSRSDITAAEDKVVGFDYQYYYFLLCLLNLNKDETIGLEVKDDVHIEQANGVTILAQLKHTINPQNSNLTELDSDFWKTLYNWALLIEESAQLVIPTETEDTKFNFCHINRFVLITNKGAGPRNDFLNKLSDFRISTLTITDIRAYLENLHSKTADTTIKLYISTVLLLSDRTLSVFLFHLKIETDFDDILEKIKNELHKLFIRENKIDSLLKLLDGALRQASYETVKNHQKFIFTYDEFHRKYELYFQMGRSDELLIEEYDCIIDNPLEQHFIEQLIDIEDVYEDEIDDIIKYTSYKLTVFNNLMRWLQEGQITESQWDKFQSESVTIWDNIFKKTHRSVRKADLTTFTTDEFSNLIKLAQSCLDEIRNMDLKIRGQQLGIQLSNGQFYHLSDLKKIGWVLYWKRKYGAA
ncbi:hypothetical protein I2I05_04285 [Hymenobacter sp. BT683]|uniref:DUF4297 domain-containing protein n=1 Tax=Hymenobacter jeongseonensis TaxID=2791027 RepID=A0ABS0IEL3_9BACT|nr:hypothetical protein [Hymenobacter jeongseonensis]MBF9236607.1 hypothetical protein [Hymenobacter jeongseonensis]